MTRQKVRRALILASLLAFPVTIFYFSPSPIIMAAGEGIVADPMLAFVALLTSALVLGRAWCGWAACSSPTTGRWREGTPRHQRCRTGLDPGEMSVVRVCQVP